MCTDVPSRRQFVLEGVPVPVLGHQDPHTFPYHIPACDPMCFSCMRGQHVESISRFRKFRPLLWIRIGSNADPDIAFYLNADPGPGSQSIAVWIRILVGL